MFEILMTVVFIWLFCKFVKLAFRVTWGLAKGVALVLFLLSLPALIACLLLRVFYKKGQKPSVLRLVCCTVPAEIFMALGYFAYKATVLGAGMGAAAGIPADLMQGLMGVIISVVLFRLLYEVPALRERFWKG